jgi:CysZ protein
MVLSVWLGAIGDLFGKPLRGLLLICALIAGALLGGLVWIAITFLLPLIPDGSGWFSWADDAGAIVGGLASIVLAVLLFPMVAMITGGVLFDVAAGRVEKLRFPKAAPGRFMKPHEGALAGLKIAGPALLLNVLALPLMFIPIVNVIAFTTLNAFLMGREYFSLAALRYGDWEKVRALRIRFPLTIILAALLPAFLVALPTFLPIAPFLIPLVAIVSFPAPLLGAAVMVRLHQALQAQPALKA